MTADLTRTILQRAYELDGVNLDQQARALGAENWQTLTGDLTFSAYDSGGGCLMLAADLPGGHMLAISDGDTGLPRTADTFCLVVQDQDGEEVLSVDSNPLPA
jgi:hypothetical protein